MNSLLKTSSYINGQWIGSAHQTTDVINPSTQEKIGTIPVCAASDVETAIEAAEQAFPDWSSRLATERQAILERWYDLIIEHTDDLAEILTAEQGKPLSEARGEVIGGAGFVKWYAEEGRRIYGDVIPSQHRSQSVVVFKQPIGVVGMITPWNFPSSMITRKVAAALGAGCTVVLKPSELTPFSALALAELADKAGIPKGVLNIVTGKASVIGQVLTESPKVKKLSFTGSTAVGKMLMAQSANTVKKLSLELGGNAPFIVFDDADLDAAVAGAIISKFRNAGQTCICANRIFVHDAVFDEFMELFVEKTKALTIGDGRSANIDIGPMVNVEAVENTKMIVQDAIDQGAEICAGGQARPDLGSCFYMPTIIKGVTSDMRCFQEEIFGPVAAVYRFSDDEEIIRIANDTEYGLAAYMYTSSLARSWDIPARLDYGMVGVNSCLLSLPQAPFGGVKMSGFGKEGSKYGLDDYINIKYVSIQR